MKTKNMFQADFASIFNIRNNPVINHIVINKWLYKVILILVLLIIITIFIRQYTIYLASLKYKKFKEEKQERINKFTEDFKSSYENSVEGFETAQIQEFLEELWQTSTRPFSFDTTFQKSFGYLYGNEDIIEGGIFDVLDPNKNGIAKGAQDFGNQIKRGFEELGKILGEVLRIKDIVDGIITAVNDAGRRFTYFGNGIATLFRAFGFSMQTMFYEGIPTIGNDLASIIYGGGVCTIHFANNFRSCLLYWIVDLFAEVMYSVLVLIPLYIFDAMFPSLNLPTMMDEFKLWMDYVDELITKMLGFSCFHYPESVINDCYKCKQVDFPRKVRELKEDSTRLNKALDKLGYDYVSAFYQIGRAFS
jgi:hypothetical protein